MTINKSQGQSFDMVLVDLTTDNFSHGHLYVALSRIISYSRIRLMVDHTMQQHYHDYDLNEMKQMPVVTTA